MINRSIKTKIICNCSVMIALGTVLSIFKIEGIWALGGGVTICSMLPLVLISYYYGIRWGIISSFIYSLIQIILGIDNLQYANSFLMAFGIIMLDYVLAYTSIGFSGIFKNRISNKYLSVIYGIALTFILRFLCHFFSGWMIWDSLWPNEFGLVSPFYSFLYNGSYMLPELVITSFVSAIAVKVIPEKVIN